MRSLALCALLAIAASPCSGQTATTKDLHFHAHAVVRGTDDRMHIALSGDPLQMIGVDRPCTCSVSIGPDSANARGPIKGELSNKPGALTFRSVAPTGEIEVIVARKDSLATPMYSVRGWEIRLERDASGAISVLRLR